MAVKLCLFLLLVCAAEAIASPGFLLGVNYSEWLNVAPNTGAQIATDGSGALYILSNPSASVVTKLSADGKTMVWQNALGFTATAMAVDPSGGVYVVPAPQQGETSGYVAKLGASGTGLAWTTAAGFVPMMPPVVAADSEGRAYLAAQYMTTNYTIETAYVVRLNAAGSAIDYRTQFLGRPSSIAVDSSGGAYVSGTEDNAEDVSMGFLARFAPDGSAGFYSLLALGVSQTVALDANGNVALYGAGLVQRVNSAGAVTVSTKVAAAGQFAVDAAGNAYVVSAGNGLFAAKNSLATCGFDPSASLTLSAQTLTVVAPDGSILQNTYLPGGNVTGVPLVANGPNSTVFIAATAGPAFVPTQTGPFAAGKGIFLLNLSPNSSAPIYPLACMGSSASLGVGAIAPGELVSLFGSGLGPQQGVATQATAQSPYPTEAAGVSVSFDGLAAPLLWVQDGQINAIVPWALTPGRNTQVCVSNTNCLAWPVVETAPAVFTVDGTYAAALNEDGSVNSAANPAPVGSIVSVLATGLGPISPPQADGALVGAPLPTNALTVSVIADWIIAIGIGNPTSIPLKVTYAGPVAGLVAGVSQISFQVVSFPAFSSIGGIYLGSAANTGFFKVYIAGQ
jgi:uncharacterized protein (TIGR03437 family)